MSGLMNKANAAAGGGPESEKKEDALDKGKWLLLPPLPPSVILVSSQTSDIVGKQGVDFVQERFLGQGPQTNESAIEQAKDEQISDFIRSQYKSTTGKEFPVKDK